VSFKDQAIADLPTFLNVDEFGDTVDIDGVTMACVLDNDEAHARRRDGVSINSSSRRSTYQAATSRVPVVGSA
jgi:hypothetical protein